MSYLTLREKVNEMIQEINKIYEDAGSLRDGATLAEKKHWNELRGIMYNADKPLRELNDNLGTKEYQLPDSKTWYKKG